MNKKIFFLELLLVPTLLYFTSCSSSITKRNPFENFEHLRGGMTEAEVIRILGKPDSTSGHDMNGINYSEFDYNKNNFSRDVHENRSLEFADGKLYKVRGISKEGGYVERKLYLFDKEIYKEILRVEGQNENLLDTLVELELIFTLSSYNQIDPEEYKVKYEALQAKFKKIVQADENVKSIQVDNYGQSKKNYIKPNKSSVVSAAGKVSYDDAKKKLTKQYINKEITKEEYFEMFKKIRASYGK